MKMFSPICTAACLARSLRFPVLSLCICALLFAWPAPAAGEPLVINTTARAPHYTENGSGFFNLLVDEIFRRLDIEHRLIWLPAERSLVFTNNGTVDGVVPRASAIEAQYPNLVRVPIEVFEFEFMAYSRNPAIEIDGWASLKPHIVGAINGWKIVEQNLGNAGTVVRVNNYRQLLTLLDKGRIDVAILDRVMGGLVLREQGFDLAVIEPPLSVQPTYFYLHQKHRELVPGIAAILTEIKRDGTYEAIYTQALTGFVGTGNH